jgi:hypothetical protein
MVTAFAGLAYAGKPCRYRWCRTFAYIQLVAGELLIIPMLPYALFTLPPLYLLTVIYLFKTRHRGGENESYQTYTEFTTVINTDAGKKKKIVERDSGRLMYDYLTVGDRVHYHPMFGTYEKYDKSKDRIIYCNVCSTKNLIQNDRCKQCNNLLFK